MSGKTSIAVLGGGSWGTALAHLLAHAGHSVALLLRDTEQAAHINAHHENPRYLRGVPLHPGIRAVAGDTGGPEQAEVLSLKTVTETYGSEQVTESAFINRKPGSGIHS